MADRHDRRRDEYSTDRDFGEELPRRDPGQEDRGGLRLAAIIVILGALAGLILYGVLA